MTRPNRHDAPWSSSVERCLGLVHSATPYFHPIGGRPPRSAAHLRQAHYLISRTACSKPTKRSSKRPATLGVAFSPSPPPSPQSATAAGRTSVRNEGRWYHSRDSRARGGTPRTHGGVGASNTWGWGV